MTVGKAKKTIRKEEPRGRIGGKQANPFDFCFMVNFPMPNHWQT